MKKYILGLGTFATVLLLAGAGCANAPVADLSANNDGAMVKNEENSNADLPVVENSANKDEENNESDNEAMKEESAGSVENAVAINVSGKNFSFTPNVIKVKKGQTVTVNFTSDSGFHDFVIDELNVYTDKLQGPASQSVTFTADKIGTFEFYCSVGQHRAMGMKGTLVVE